MRFYIVGIACVGKTTIGSMLADYLGYKFFDFDAEVKASYNTTIMALKNQCWSESEYRKRVRPLLSKILNEHSDNMVISMPPGGLFREYKSLLDGSHSDVITIALRDKPQNILDRLIFTEDDDTLITEPVVNCLNKDLYLRDIKEDIRYFDRTHKKANVVFNIEGRDAPMVMKGLFEELAERYGLEANPRTDGKRALEKYPWLVSLGL